MEANLNKPEKKRYKVIKGIFIPSILFLLFVVLWGIIDNASFGSVTGATMAWIQEYLSSGIIIFTTFILIFTVAVAISPAGRIKLGGSKSKPEFTNIQWFAMTLCGGIGVGIMFWGVAEPLTHFMNTPANLGIEPGTPAAAIAAMKKVFLHYSYYPYAIYSLFAVAIGYFAYNKGKPMQTSGALYPILGEGINKWQGKVIDFVTVFAVVGGLCTSLIFGVQQLSNGLGYLFNFEVTTATWVIVIAVTTVIFTLSSYTGLKRGIKYMSTFNLCVYLTLFVLVFLFGAKLFCIDLGVESVGYFLNDFLSESLQTDAFDQSSGWYGGWTAFYWCWYWTLAPIVGIFFARISRGRTIRAVIIMNMVATGTFGILWFVVFGGNGLFLQMTGKSDIWTVICEKGNDYAMIEFLNNFPISWVLVAIAMLGVGIGFATQADSVCTSLSILTTNMTQEDTLNSEPPAYVKITWGVLMGALAIVIMLVGTASAIQTTAIIFSVPLEIVTILLIAAVAKEFYGKFKKDAERYKMDTEVEADIREIKEKLDMEVGEKL